MLAAHLLQQSGSLKSVAINRSPESPLTKRGLAAPYAPAGINRQSTCAEKVTMHDWLGIRWMIKSNCSPQ